ncbi:hypothetical protein Leryth_006335 [Lithospermum erythrorhizon]|nr:hypothetical protein Leryth_006335 [Lithospermum erythrorhizon]
MSTPPPDTAATLLRPWRQFLDTTTISLPLSLSDATSRFPLNLRFYTPNYTLITLLIFLLLLLPHPLLLLLFLLLSLSWTHLYFLRLHPLEILGFDIDDRLIVGVLGGLSLLGLFWGRVWGSLVVALAIGGVVGVVHGVIKAPDDDIEGSPYGEMLSDLDGGRGDYVRV